MSDAPVADRTTPGAAIAQPPEAAAARRTPTVAAEMFRQAVAQDRYTITILVLGALFVAAVVPQTTGVADAWLWCLLCLFTAAVRLIVHRPAWLQRLWPQPQVHRRHWLVALFAASLAWGLAAPMFLNDAPEADVLLTGVMLATAALSAPLLAASRTGMYCALLGSIAPLLLTLVLRPLLGPREEVVAALLLAVLAAAFLTLLLRLTLDQSDSLALLLAVRFRNEGLLLQLRSQIDVADLANQEKSRFLASAAHDLRQPLHALGMFCGALDRRLVHTPEKPLVRNMMRAIESLETSFNAMLDISRLDAGIVPVNLQHFPVRDVFRRLYQQFGGDAEARGLALRFRATRKVLHSDPQQVERILTNLVQNALRYTKEGGVLIAARRHASGVALEVWDTGVGIPDDKIDMIFREFFQIDNPERDRGRGLGLGLAIVQRICALLRHRLEVQSRAGRGSVFRLLVPAGDAQAVAAAGFEAETLPPRREGPITVLLIDDDPAIREATRELLQPMAIDVLTASDIAEAVCLATDPPGGRIDLILSDWRLRGQENGVDAVNAVRAVTGPSTPAVLITGETAPSLLAVAHENGLVVMHKPLQPRQLLRLINHLRR